MSSGTFQAVRLHGDVYLLQVRDDDSGLLAVFYEFTYRDGRVSYRRMDINEETIYSLAAAYGVTIDPEFMYVEGQADRVRSFLFAHGPEHLIRY